MFIGKRTSYSLYKLNKKKRERERNDFLRAISHNWNQNYCQVVCDSSSIPGLYQYLQGLPYLPVTPRITVPPSDFSMNDDHSLWLQLMQK